MVLHFQYSIYSPKHAPSFFVAKLFKAKESFGKNVNRHVATLGSPSQLIKGYPALPSPWANYIYSQVINHSPFFPLLFFQISRRVPFYWVTTIVTLLIFFFFFWILNKDNCLTCNCHLQFGFQNWLFNFDQSCDFSYHSHLGTNESGYFPTVELLFIIP